MANLSARKADYSKFQALNVQILAISTNHPFSQKMFAESLQLPYPLLSDFPDLRVTRQYGGLSLNATLSQVGIAERARMSRAWTVFLERYPLVLSPFLMRPTYPWNYDVQGFEQTKDLFDAAIYSYSINYLGLPAGVVPVGLVEGLPAAVQLVGRRFREDTILDAGVTAGSSGSRDWCMRYVGPRRLHRTEELAPDIGIG